MTTSAQALNQILTAASSHRPFEDRFLSVVALQLGLECDRPEVEAIDLLLRLLLRIEADIEEIPASQDEKERAHKYLVPFGGLKNFSHVYMSIKQAKDNFLKAENLIGLVHLHMIISKHKKDFDIDSETKRYADDIRQLRSEILEIGLPLSVQKIVSARLAQVAAMLDTFYAFGADALQTEIEAIVGKIILHPPAKDTAQSDTIKKVFGTLFAVLNGIKAADAGVGSAISITQKGYALLKLLSSSDE